MKIQNNIIFLSLIFCILLLSGCEKSHPDSPVQEAEHKEYPTQEGWNSTYRISRAGQPQAVIQYGHMSQYENQKITYFDKGVIVDFYDETGQHTSKLTSDRGIYNEETNDVFGIGNVVVLSDTGVTLYTEKIRWDQTREKILSDTLVTVVTEDSDTLYGLGFESTPDLKKMVFKETRGTTHKRVNFDKVESELKNMPVSDSLDIEPMDGDSL